MKASQLCALREDFIREWQKDFPLVPPPPLRGIDRVQESDVIDESQASGHIATLWGSVHAVNNKLDQLDEQIRRKQRVRDFLISLLKTFDSDFEEKASFLKQSSDSNVRNVGSVVSSSSNGATIVTVTSGDRCVTPCRDNVYPNKRGVLCVPSKSCTPATVCNHNSSSSPVSCSNEIINTCEKACSTEFTTFSLSDKVDVGVQCDLKQNKGNVFTSGDNLAGYKSVIDHRTESEWHVKCVSVNGCVTDSGRNTEVCNNIPREDNGDDYVDESEFYYDNNWVLKEHSGGLGNNGDMFGKRKKGSGGVRGGGDECGSLRGGKDNFLAVTSQSKLHQQEESSTGRHPNRDVDGGGGGGVCGGGGGGGRRGSNSSIVSTSPSLARNFQLLKLTSGFDLVLDDSDSNCSTDDQHSGADHSDKSGYRNKHSGKSGDNTTSPIKHTSDNNNKQSRDSKPSETYIRDVNDPGVKKDNKSVDDFHEDDDDDADDTTPTCGDFDALKFDYRSRDISKVLDGNPPDLVSSTLSSTATTMISNRNCQSSKPEGTGDGPESPNPAHTKLDSKRSSGGGGGPPPPVARKPARLGTGKKLPSIPVGVEPVTRPVASKRGQHQQQQPDDNVVSDPIAICQNQRHSSQSIISSDNSNNGHHHTFATTSQSTSNNNTMINPSSNLTTTNSKENVSDGLLDNNNSQGFADNNNDPSSLRPSSPSLSSFLSSSPDFRASMVAGIIPASPLSDVAIGQSNPNRQSNFYCGVDLASLPQTNNNNNNDNDDDVIIRRHKTRTDPDDNCPDKDDDGDDSDDSSEDKNRKSSLGLNDLVHGTNSTMILISQADPYKIQSCSSSNENANDENSINSGTGSSGISSSSDATANSGGGVQLRANKNEMSTSPSSMNGTNQISQSSSSSSPVPTSPPPPPLPKRESRVSSSMSSSNADNKPFHNNSHSNERLAAIHDGGMAEGKCPNIHTMVEVASVSYNTTMVYDDDDDNNIVDCNTLQDDSAFTITTEDSSNRSSGGSYTKQEYSRMSSTDTLVDDQQQPSHRTKEYRRSESFTSDIDVKDAISAFDQIISAQCPDLLEEMDDNTTMESQKSIKTRRRSSSVINYENWTINRALTASISSRCRSESLNLEEFNFIDEGDTGDNDGATSTNDDNSSNASMPSPDLHRPGGYHIISHGSKDSGLCDDMSAASDSVHSELDLTGGRISDLRQIQEMERWEEEEATGMIDGVRRENATMSVTPCEYVTDYDSVSLTSDIVFLSGSIAKKRQARALQRREGDDDDDEDDDEDIDGREGRLDTSSTASSLEESDGRSMNTSYDETDSGHEGMLKMRQLLIKGVLDSEKAFLSILELLIHYKKILAASSQTSQPVVNDADIRAIFGNIETLRAIHLTFVTSLEAKVKAWTHAECVGEIFKIFVLSFPEFRTYVSNYSNAVSTIHKCGQENERFQEIATEVIVKSTITTKENIRLEDALFKPVQRVQRNSLVLHDLIKYTPEDHPDHAALQKALKLSQHNLESFEAVVPHANTNPENRRLVKSSFLVELVNGVRKLRYMFVFSDILICTKRETHRNNRVTFQIKWYAPLANVTYDTKFGYKDDTKFSKKDDINELKNKIRGLKKEMKAEMKKFDDKDKHRSLVIGGAARTVEKLRKKVLQYEGQLILASPKLPFKVSLEGGKVYTLLMTTDYEKEEWKEALNALCKRNTQRDSPQAPFSSIIVQDLIDSVKETPQVNKIGNVLLQKDEEILTGTLNVTIHKMNGLSKECDTYCCLEMDSFGHFFMMARTKMCEASRDPNWNEDFELELEGSMTLRILCFMKAEGEDGDRLLGRGALELDKHWLKGSFQEKTISMNEISLVVSVRHTAAEKTMQRTPSRTRSAVFGVEISSCARREGKTVPTIITACIKEVEKRGLDEVGIYRVSGVTSDLQRTKKLFDRNISAGASSLEDIDINAVTGSLKLYLRELPEPLFTEAAYQKFVGTLKLSDEEAKSQCILRLLHELPDTNYYTIVCLLEHLVKVARYVGENKMSIHNLSTIFGPTLLAPASKLDMDKDPLALMWQGAEQVMQQSGVVSYLLGLAVSGRSLRRSSS